MRPEPKSSLLRLASLTEDKVGDAAKEAADHLSKAEKLLRSVRPATTGDRQGAVDDIP